MFPCNWLCRFFNTTGLDSVFAVQLCAPAEDGVNTNIRPGSLTLGGVDPTAHVGNITWVPMNFGEFGLDRHYGITVTGVSIGNTRLEDTCELLNTPAPAIVDTGTTLLALPEDTYLTVLVAVGFVLGMDSAAIIQLGARSTCYSLSTTVLNLMPDIKIHVLAEDGLEQTLIVTPFQYMRPLPGQAELNNFTSPCRSFAIESGCGTVIGLTVLTGYLTVFDLDNERVGFATSTCANVSADDDRPELSTPVATDITLSSCRAQSLGCAANSESSLNLTPVLIPLAIILVVLLIVLGVQWWRSRKKQTETFV